MFMVRINKKHLKYFSYVMRHKWFVFIAGLRVGGIPRWRLIIHDYTKFSRAEWTPYVNRFFSGRTGVEDKSKDDDDFKAAWLHHWTRNKHHWEYWDGALGTAMMPETYVREMIADWMGAGRAISGSWDLTDWYNSTKNKIRLANRTLVRVEELLREQGYAI
jgi:hypothetical protein